MEYLNGNPSLIRFVPEKFQTQNMWDNIIENDLSNIVFVPSKFQTIGMWSKYVEVDRYRLNEVPRDFREIVAEKLKIKKNCITDQNDIDFVVDSIKNMKTEINNTSLTPEILITLLKNKYCSLDDINKNDLTREIVLEYLEENNYDFNSILKLPKKFISQDMWNKCAEKSNYNIDILRNIPDDFQTQDMWNKYIESNNNIDPQKIPDDFQTQDMWDNFFEKNPAQIKKYVDFFGGHFMISQETWNTYAELYPENIYKIPSQFQTQDMWNKYCQKDATIVGNNVPSEFQTQCMWNNFVIKLSTYGKSPKEILALVPDKFRSREIFDLLLKLSNYSLDVIYMIPQEFQTQQLWNEFVKIYDIGYENFKYIPSQFRNNIIKNSQSGDFGKDNQ